MKIKPVKPAYSIDYKDFEDEVIRYYGFVDQENGSYDFVFDMDAHNNSHAVFSLSPTTPLDEEDKQELKKFKESNGKEGWMMAPRILQEWVNIGKIPPGTYIITIWW